MMAVYTVHEPPQRAGRTLPDAVRFAFVRDGFSWAAFLFGPLWMLWHRMWLVLVGYLVVSIGIERGLLALGASSGATAFVGLLIAILVGLEASTLRRLTLAQRGWQNVGVVSGDDMEDAERRFFDAWLRDDRAPARGPLPPPLPGGPAAPPRMPQAPDVIGLFPNPGASR